MTFLRNPTQTTSRRQPRPHSATYGGAGRRIAGDRRRGHRGGGARGRDRTRVLGDDDEGVDVDAGSPGSRSTTEVTSTSQPPAGNVLPVWPHSGELAMQASGGGHPYVRDFDHGLHQPDRRLPGRAAPTAGEGTVAVRARTDGLITTVSLHQRADKGWVVLGGTRPTSCSSRRSAAPRCRRRSRAVRRRGRSRATSSSTSRTAIPRPSAGASTGGDQLTVRRIRHLRPTRREDGRASSCSLSQPRTAACSVTVVVVRFS